MQWALDPDGDPSTDDGAHILNMSLGASGQYEVFRSLVEKLLAAGVLPVFAIGNNGKGQADAPGNTPGALSVGATSLSDAVAPFSGGGEVTWSGAKHMKPELSAPGTAIESTVPHGKYQTLSGTSMAAPHVAGAAALLLEARPGLPVDEIKSLLFKSAVDVDAPGMDARSGRGRLDVLAALSALMNVSIVRGQSRNGEGPMPATIRVRDQAGRITKVVRSDAETGQFQVALAEGDYTVEASFGAAKGVQKALHVGSSAVVNLDFFFNASNENLDSLLVYPNPFKPARGDQTVTFDGLPENAKIAVYSFSGDLVRELSGAAGGQFVWDARTGEGQPVAAGLYFYVASSYNEGKGWEHNRGKLMVMP
jgi:hypothetical protein